MPFPIFFWTPCISVYINIGWDHLDFGSEGEEVIPDRVRPWWEEQEEEVEETDGTCNKEESKPEPEKNENLLNNIIRCQNTKEGSVISN